MFMELKHESVYVFFCFCFVLFFCFFCCFFFCCCYCFLLLLLLLLLLLFVCFFKTSYGRIYKPDKLYFLAKEDAMNMISEHVIYQCSFFLKAYIPRVGVLLPVND